MKNLHFITTKAVLGLYMNQIALQQQLAEAQRQLVEAQQKIIALQQQVIDMTPKNAPDEDIKWHIYSRGVMSSEAANSDDLEQVQRFSEWITDFAKKHIKPYVNPAVYGECHNQMTRGLAERLAELTTARDMQKIQARLTSPKSKKTTKPDILQLPLIKEG